MENKAFVKRFDRVIHRSHVREPRDSFQGLQNGNFSTDWLIVIVRFRYDNLGYNARGNSKMVR